MPKDNSVYIEHILESIFTIEEYLKGHSKESFLGNKMVQDAVVRQFEIVGEATKRLSANFKERNSHIPWKNMAGMRDILIHDYIGVDLWQVWDTAKDDLPDLKEKLKYVEY
jgi:uncharacterized protein with HEPN domain